MKRQKCPYCGRRISYPSAFASRRKGEYVCTRCARESKVVINKTVILVFAVFAVLALAIMAGIIITKTTNNPFGIVLVAIPLIIFLFLSPLFVKFEPLKKYKKTMEARKAGIEYSDNLSISGLENETAPIVAEGFDAGGFKINSDVFNKIKAERTAARTKIQDSSEILSDSKKMAVENNSENQSDYVSVIENVSENHSSDSAPLRKIHSDNSLAGVRRDDHYISEKDDEGVKIARRKSDGNRYTGNRKF